MHSFISNSNTRIPDLNYRKIAFFTIAILTLTLIVSEIFFRKRGFQTNITDSTMYWGLKRKEVYKNNHWDKIVIVGASRAQLGIVPKTIEDELTHYKAIHLTIDGTSYFYVLKDLCEDVKFNGVIFFSVTAGDFKQRLFEKAKPWVDYYHKNVDGISEIGNKLNTIIQVNIQDNFVITSSALNIRRIIYSRLSPKPLYSRMQKDRYRPAFFYERLTPDKLSKHRKHRIEKIVNKFEKTNDNFESKKKEFKKAMKELRNYYVILKSRGGDLILIRMPTTDEHWSVDEINYPKQIFWDQITKLTGIPTVHFKDYASLNSFDCPDTSHLDATDSPQFTKSLVSIIKNKIGIP